ncbi:AbrB/MazE/SpoVT family DNA-binding domain-containing protein [Candidatus Poribacteria bacterium]|nr:AbrB/MazE/SpoVT family DNA-binding domain-containing protein [Candidatus Poribacteria bacterium]
MNILLIRRNFQVTIPAKFRQRLGLKEGDVIEAELENNEIILKPKEVVGKTRLYSRKEISDFIEEDQLSPKVLAKAKKLLGEY